MGKSLPMLLISCLLPKGTIATTNFLLEKGAQPNFTLVEWSRQCVLKIWRRLNHYSGGTAERHKGEWGREPSVPTPFALSCSSTTPALMFFAAFPDLNMKFHEASLIPYQTVLRIMAQSWAEVPFCLHEIPSTVCFWKQDLSCTTDVSSREEDKSAKLPECRDQIRSLGWGTRLIQVACPHQNINFSSLRGVSKASQPCCEREPMPKRKKQQFVSKFKCSYDSRWRLKIPVRVAVLEHWCLWFCWYSETRN